MVEAEHSMKRAALHLVDTILTPRRRSDHSLRTAETRSKSTIGMIWRIGSKWLGTVPKDQLALFLHEYITTVVTHYAARSPIGTS